MARCVMFPRGNFLVALMIVGLSNSSDAQGLKPTPSLEYYQQRLKSVDLDAAILADLLTKLRIEHESVETERDNLKKERDNLVKDAAATKIELTKSRLSRDDLIVERDKLLKEANSCIRP